MAIVVSADGVTTNEFTTLQAAFDAAQAGETVELLADLTIEAKVTASAFTGTFDLGGFTIDTTLVKADDIPLLGFENGCNVVITNGTIDIETTELDVADSTATLAANTTISSDGGYGVYVSGTGVFNIYGTITGSVDSMPCVWMGGTSTVNAYEGCVVDSVGDPFRINGSGRTLNIYGGTFRGGYPIVYVYNSNTSAINVYGGTFTSVNGLIGGNARETVVVTPLTDQCTAKFSRAAPDDSWSLGLDYYCAEGYGPKLVDGWYVIAQLPVVELVNAGNKGTVTLDQTVGTSVAFGGTVSGTVDANEGYTPFVFVDGQKVAVGQDGAFTGIANNSGKVVVAYAKDSAWYMDPFVKNDAIVRAVFHPSGLADLAFSPDRTKLFAGIDTYNYSSCYDTYNGVLQYGASDLLSYIGSYSGTPENGYLANATVGYLCGNMEGVRSVIPMTDGVMVGPQQGALGDGIHKNGDNIILPMGGAWGGADEATGLAKEDDDRYFLDLPANDLDNGTVGAFNTHGLQWTIAGVQSTDGNSLYVAFHARNEITKATIGKDSNGKITLTKTGIFWRTWDVVGKNNEYNATALALYNNGEKDFIYAARADGKVFLLDEETASGNEYTNVKTGETVYDKKMIELLDLSANQTEYYGSYNSGKDEYTPSNSGIRSMFVSGVADGTPHLVVQFTCGHTFVFALNPDGSLASTTPIADIDGASLGVMANTTPKEIGEKATGFSAKGLQAAVGTDDETTLVGNYAENGYHLAVITAKPENVIVRGTFGDYEDGENTEFAYGAAAEVVFNAPAGKQITAVKVNGVADANFTPAAYTFTDAALTKNVYVEMTVEPVVAMIGTTGYKTLAAAATAAVDNDTIVLLDDYTLAAEENVVFSKKVTLDLGDNQLTIRSDNKSFVIAVDGDLTLTNGTITGTANYGIKVEGTLTVADIDMDAQGAGPCFDMYATASITVNSGSFLNFHDVFRLTKVENATPTVVVNGGTFSSTQYGAFYAYKKNCSAAITINGGTFETQFLYASDAAVGFVWTEDKLDDTCKAKFKVIAKHDDKCLFKLADFIAPGYAPVLGQDGYYTIQKVYDVTIAPTENGTVETSVTNGIVAGTEVTITATPAANYAVDTIAVTNGDQEVTVESGKFLMPAGNVTVYVTFKSTAAPGIIPGEEKDVPGASPAEAQEAADKLPITLTAEQEAAGLKTEYFHNLVKPNTAGDGFVAYVEVKEELAPTLDTTTEDDPIEVDATNFSATISNAKKGLYYGFKAVDALGTTATFEPVGEFKTPDESGSLTISAPKGEGNARFYKLTVSITDLTPGT